MREITTKKDDKTTVTIKSPWLDVAGASRYLGISRSEFIRVVANNVLFKGFGNHRRFHVTELDKFNPPSVPAKDEVAHVPEAGGAPS